MYVKCKISGIKKVLLVERTLICHYGGGEVWMELFTHLHSLEILIRLFVFDLVSIGTILSLMDKSINYYWKV